jgi:hypothetical protein
VHNALIGEFCDQEGIMSTISAKTTLKGRLEFYLSVNLKKDDFVGYEFQKKIFSSAV